MRTLTGCVTAAIAVLVVGVAALAVVKERSPTSSGARQPACGHRQAGPAPYGSGAFGRWAIESGLPVYRFQPRAHAGLVFGRDGNAAAQLGNDHVVALALNHGYVQLWSEDRGYEWINRYDSGSRHYSGGFGYLRIDGQTISTLSDDRPSGASATQDFGVGYVQRCVGAADVAIGERVYAPFGDDPVLLHDVTLRNLAGRPQDAAWVEYWDVNPVDQRTHAPIGVGAARFDPVTRTLAVAQEPSGEDRQPLTIFAAALRGAVAGVATSTSDFFGHGSRAAPAAVARGIDAGPSTDPAGLLAIRTVVHLRARSSITLRYAYGAAPAGAIPAIVSRYRRARDPFAASTRRWAQFVPRLTVAGRDAWLARELAWDAYLLRSGATYDAECGHHVISQGGYYQYGLGMQIAFRDPLQLSLPMTYLDPALTREILLYSAQQQRRDGALPFGVASHCRPVSSGPGESADLDLWLLLAASEYGLASRDLQLFSRRVPFADGHGASMWDHLKLAVTHQESQRGPHGDYRAGPNGDWSDGSSRALGMRESTLVTAQLAYVYPRLAELATAIGDQRFAARLRMRARGLLRTLRDAWVPRGWYARGWGRRSRIGVGVIYGEPQPWAILAAAPDNDQAATLVGNIRRYLSGVGAPAQAHGPARIGSSQSPARNDPGVTERTRSKGAMGVNNAVFVGDVWYAVNGWLTWALASLGGRIPGAREAAYDEWRRNTLAAHAAAYPRRWDGVLSVDDVCAAHYEPDPSGCGLKVSDEVQGLNLHQPAWTLWDAIKLAGIQTTADGITFDPQLPARHFALTLPDVGVIRSPDATRGFVRVARTGPLVVRVRVRSGDRVTVTVAGRHVHARVSDGFARFRIRARAGKRLDWLVAAPHAPR